MSGIFISYASEDRDRARILAHALEQRGWPVWWDREIPLGKAFDEVIEENLTRAQCVLVLWSRASVESRWVRAEASAAAARGVLIPVLLEQDIMIPLQFRLLHAADLSDWDGSKPHAEFRSLAAHVGRMLNVAPEALADSTREGATSAVATRTHSQSNDTKERVRATEEAGRRQKLRHALAFALLPTALIGMVTLLLMNWHIATAVRIDLAVDRVAFTIGGGQSVEIPVQPLNFRSLTIENFDRIRFTPERFMLGAVDDGNTSGPFEPGDEVTLEGAADGRPMLTITSAESVTGATGQLEQIVLNPQSELILEVSNEADPRLTVRVYGQDLEANILPASTRRGEFGGPLSLDLSAIDASLSGVAAAASVADPNLRKVTLAPYAPYVAIEGARRDFAVTATLDGTQTVALGARVPVSEVEFLEQGSHGHSRTTLMAPGSLVYPGYPGIAAIVVQSDDFIEIGELKDARLSRLILDPENGRLEVRLEGEAGRLAVNEKTEYRLTLLDRLWHGRRTTVLLAILAWAFSVSAGAYKLYRDVTKS